MSDYPDWQTPAAAAAQIAAAGVPLLARSDRLLNLAGQPIAGGATYSSPLMPVTQIGYELVIAATTAGNPATPFIDVNLDWYDSVSGINVEVEAFFVPVSTTAPGIVVAGTGPTRADQLRVRIINHDAAVPCAVNLTVLENSRVYNRADQHWVNSLCGTMVVPGYTLARLPADSEVLGLSSNAPVPAGTTTTWLVGMGAARLAVLSVNLGAAVLTSTLVNLLPQPQGVFGPAPIMVPSVPPADDYNVQFIAPRAPMALEVTNNAAGPITVSWSVLQQQ